MRRLCIAHSDATGVATSRCSPRSSAVPRRGAGRRANTAWDVVASQAPRLDGAGPPLRLRVVRRSLADVSDRAKITAKVARRIVAEDVAADIVGLLDGPGRLNLDGEAQPVSPGDIAVLVRTNDQAAMVRDTLATAVSRGTHRQPQRVPRPDRARLAVSAAGAGAAAPGRAGARRSADPVRRLDSSPARRLGRRGHRRPRPAVAVVADVLAERGVAALLE